MNGWIRACFPRSWRRDGRADEAMGISADAAADRGRRSPSLIDVADLAWLAMQARAGVVGRAMPPPVRRLVAGLATASGLALSIALFMAVELDPGRHLDVWTYASPPVGWAGRLGSDRRRAAPFVTLGVVVEALWLLVALAVLTGRRGAARAAVLGTLAATVAVPVAARWYALDRPSLYVLGALAACSVLTLGTGPVVREPFAVRAAWVAGGTGLGLVLAGHYGANPVPHHWSAEFGWTGTGVGGSAFVVLGLLAVGGLAVFFSPAHRSGWPAAALIAALPWAVLATRTITAPWTAPARLETGGVVVLAWLAAVGRAAASSTGGPGHLVRTLRHDTRASGT